MAYHEFTIKIAAPFADALIKRLVSAGCLGTLERDNALIAYFPETVDIKAINNELSIFQALLEKLDKSQDLTISHELIPDQDWNESWKKGFQPLDIGKQFTLLPPWEEKKPGRVNLVIDPGMAFGTGHHETTRSCLVLMEKYAASTKGKKSSKAFSRKAAKLAKKSKSFEVRTSVSFASPCEMPYDFDSHHGTKQSFLDLGTGTGVLALAATGLGYQRVLAIDIDPPAIEATQKNCSLNQVPAIEIRRGSLDGLDESFDVIAANLISGVLVGLAPALSQHLKPDGIALLSGILAGQEDEVIEAMQSAGLELVEKYPDGKWMSLVVRKIDTCGGFQRLHNYHNYVFKL